MKPARFREEQAIAAAIQGRLFVGAPNSLASSADPIEPEREQSDVRSNAAWAKESPVVLSNPRNKYWPGGHHVTAISIVCAIFSGSGMEIVFHVPPFMKLIHALSPEAASKPI